MVRWGVRAAWGGAALHRPQLCRHCPKPPDSLGLSQVYGAQRVTGLLGPWTEQQGHSKGRASPRPTFTQTAWHPHLTGSGQNLAREMETCPVKPTPPSPRRSLCLLLRGWACLKGWGGGRECLCRPTCKVWPAPSSLPEDPGKEKCLACHTTPGHRSSPLAFLSWVVEQGPLSELGLLFLFPGRRQSDPARECRTNSVQPKHPRAGRPGQPPPPGVTCPLAAHQWGRGCHLKIG